MSNTIDYYNRCAGEFIESSLSADMSEHYRRFLRFIPAGGRILDLGCGSGRDTKYFLSRGYAVTAVDGSGALCRAASAYTGIEVRQLLFRDIDYENRFDGVWACASLLHVAKSELPAVLEKVRRSLKPGGYLYLSFKYGTEEREKDGRTFSDFTEETLGELISRVPGLETVEQWVTHDVRPGRSGEMWVNGIVSRCGAI